METKELDIEDWELIPDHDTFLGISLRSPKKGLHINPQMDYFVCPSQDSTPAEVPNLQCLQNPEKELHEHQVFKDIGVVVPQPVNYLEPEVEEIKKMESPKLSSNEVNKKFEEEEEEVKGDDFEEIQKQEVCKEEKKPKAYCGFGGGIGALCSIGVAAATICVFVLGGRQQKQQYQNQRLQFKIYADEKRMKQVVQQASRLNQAISVAVRGVPMTRAHISFGGYYEGI